MSDKADIHVKPVVGGCALLTLTPIGALMALVGLVMWTPLGGRIAIVGLIVIAIGFGFALFDHWCCEREAARRARAKYRAQITGEERP